MSQSFLALAQIPLSSPTESSRETTVKKLQLMALQYDSRQSSVQWGNLFKVFQCSKVTIKHFHEIIKRQFLMSFTPSELFVIYEMFQPLPSTSSSSSSSPPSHSYSSSPTDLPHTFSEEDDAFRVSVDDDQRAPQLTDGNTFISCQRFLSHFFHLSKSEKQKFSEHQNYLNQTLKKKKERFETKLVKKLVNRKETKVTYPVLPNVNPSVEPSTSMTLFGESTSAPPTANDRNGHLLENELSFLDDMPQQLPSSSSPSFPSSRRRSTRKLSVLDAIAPNRHVLKLFEQEKSLVNLYPRASEDTKVMSSLNRFLMSNQNFIRDIERQEEEVKNIKCAPKKKKTNQPNFQPISQRRPDSAPSHIFRR
jgi:hypothetical protein